MNTTTSIRNFSTPATDELLATATTWQERLRNLNAPTGNRPAAEQIQASVLRLIAQAEYDKALGEYYRALESAHKAGTLVWGDAA